MAPTRDRLSYERWLHAYRMAGGTGWHAENVRLQALLYPDPEEKPRAKVLRLVVDNTRRGSLGPVK